MTVFALDNDPKQIVDELVYVSYAHNRTISPEISPAQWSRVFTDVPEMEDRYQIDLAIERGRNPQFIWDLF